MRTLLPLLLLTTAAAAIAQPGQVGERPVEPAGQPLPDAKAANVRVDGAVVEPRQLPADVTALRVPAGYRIDAFAEGLGNPRMIAVAADGTVYVTRRKEGDVLMLRDADGDGRAEQRRVVARRAGMHGIALDGRTAYLVTVKDVYTAPIGPDGSFGALTRIIDDLPDGGQHPNRTIAVGGDGMLYISAGSTCNACAETNVENATLLRATKDGKSRTIFASGLRNTIGFGWHPRTGELWGMDHGIDWLGDEQQPEELNRIELGKGYGWPYIYAAGGHNPQDDPPGGLTMADWDAMSQRMVLGTDAHAAPMQMAFYRGAMFPASEQGNAFVAMRGSWNRADPSGYDVRRLRFDASGRPLAIEPFVTGFLTRGADGGPAQRGRPVGLAVAGDGALLVGDDTNGVIYRVSYTGSDRAAAPLAPAPARRVEEPRPQGSALALARPESGTRVASLAITAPTIRRNAPIPPVHSAWYEDVSPALSWGTVPAGTKSLTLLMEDPDAAIGKPFVHWVMWNVPPGQAGLPEAVPTDPQLPMLGNARQGRNTRGSVGYFGPRPPVGDKPHRYHFQVFALDTLLAIAPGSDRETLLAAMRGHVLGKGELVGTYQQPRPPAK